MVILWNNIVLSNFFGTKILFDSITSTISNWFGHDSYMNRSDYDNVWCLIMIKLSFSLSKWRAEKKTINYRIFFFKQQIEKYYAENHNRIILSAKTKQPNIERKSIISRLIWFLLSTFVCYCFTPNIYWFYSWPSHACIGYLNNFFMRLIFARKIYLSASQFMINERMF